MELMYRRGSDVFVPPGSYLELEANLRQHAAELAEMPAVVLSCFDRSTRLMPFILYDRLLFPAGARVVAGALYQSGFTRTRAVFQLWNPNFRPSQARIDGKPLQLFLVSTMQMHVAKAYDAVRDAWKLGDARPLIIAGGPKAVHEPYHFWPLATPQGPVGPDVAVTGEVYVLLDLLNLLVEFRGRGETLRQAFERARMEGALEHVPGLVYLAPEATLREPVLVDTGLQRLVQHLDEMPNEVTALGLLEPPHRREGLSPAPLPDHKVRRRTPIVTLQLTQGCKFNCSYCPIPTLNQKTWRFRSPSNIAYQFKSVRERFGIKYYFGADDNFFNRRETAEEIFTELARTSVAGHRLKGKVCWSTEATQFDTYKNRDLLPLAKDAGLFAIWFGIEDLTAELINKGQKPEVTVELFKLMNELKICPMAMLMYHDGQPFYSPGSLYGIANQVAFLRRAGAISVQCTVHTPAIGTREFEATFATGRVIKALGGVPIAESLIDGNHVIVVGDEAAWKRQFKQLGAYATFYNPVNFFRALWNRRREPLGNKRLGYQFVGMLGTLWSAIKLLPFTVRLMVSKRTYHDAPPRISHVPVRMVANGFARFPEAEMQALELPLRKTSCAA
jgi:radical SAM superfamily enzyme YgiQ (UPF0313 family)